MKGYIQDINDLSDSRELMMAKPHPFVAFFIYLILIIITITLAWTYFGEIDIYVKANGVVRPEETVSTITNKVTGRVEEIHYSDGNRVKEGELLYTIDNTQLELQRELIEYELQKAKEELSNLNKLRLSIVDGKNHFNREVKEEQDYYNRYIQYETDLEIELRREELSSEKLNTTSNYLSDLELLSRSIIQNQNLFDPSNIVFYTRYEDYAYNVQKLEGIIMQHKDIYETRKILGEFGAVAPKEVEEAKRVYDNASLELDKYKNEYLLSINTAIEENLRLLRELEISSQRDNGLIKLGLAPQKFKVDNLVQTENQIKTYNSQIEKLEKDLEKLSVSIADGFVTAPRDGTINANIELSKGDLLQSGANVLTIIPDTESQYRIQLYVSNKDIASIKVGDQVKYHFLALPYREYGELVGEITRIGIDARADSQSGINYYMVEASIENRDLYSYKGEKAEIKVGMMSEAQVITSSKKILYYLLEKINLKN